MTLGPRSPGRCGPPRRLPQGRDSFAVLFTDIETSRLILRFLREEDRPTMIELHTDPRTTQFQTRQSHCPQRRDSSRT